MIFCQRVKSLGKCKFKYTFDGMNQKSSYCFIYQFKILLFYLLKAMNSFGNALQSGQLGPLMQQFNLPEQVSVAAAQGNLEAFAKAMEAFAQEKKAKEKKTEEESMDTK